jgi:hypothetical protein
VRSGYQNDYLDRHRVHDIRHPLLPGYILRTCIKRLNYLRRNQINYHSIVDIIVSARATSQSAHELLLLQTATRIFRLTTQQRSAATCGNVGQAARNCATLALTMSASVANRRSSVTAATNDIASHAVNQRQLQLQHTPRTKQEFDLVRARLDPFGVDGAHIVSDARRRLRAPQPRHQLAALLVA